mmetsp:Transcript_58652/g.132170  ORF Transcript_58652/g.132170 Transcript_58652/m.132170 type:complete len:483 (+) Transcript_58652:85-1533(+)
MGDTASQLWRQELPEVKGSLQWLRGWKRKELSAAFEHFRTSSTVTVTLSKFWQILRFESRALSEPAFSEFLPKNGRVDFLKVIGPMVVMSDQHMVSRASLLFSIYDFNSSAAINRAEFFIMMTSLLRGLACFFEDFQAPSNAEIELFTSTIFSRMDEDISDCVSMGEAMSYVYRSKCFRVLCSPFVSKVQNIYEEEVYFAGHAYGLEKLANKVDRRMQQKIAHKVRLTPDPPPGQAEGDAELLRRRPNKDPKRRRPWRQPQGITEDHAWVIWRVFRSLAGDECRVVSSDTLREFCNDGLAVDKLVHESIRKGKEEDGDKCVGRLVPHIIAQLHGSDILRRLEDLGGGDVSFRAFCILAWPYMKESQTEACLGWCKSFQVHKVLEELIEQVNEGKEEDLEIDQDDIETLFEVMDSNCDGRLSIDELCNQGNADAIEARRLVRKLDTDASGSLSKDEVKSLIFGMDTAVKQHIKAMFACTVADT